ncbi:hypothetical protein [Spirillospora sp. NPDC029432]
MRREEALRLLNQEPKGLFRGHVLHSAGRRGGRPPDGGMAILALKAVPDP